MNAIRLNNTTNNEIFTYPTVLIKGSVDVEAGSDLLVLKHYSNNGKQLAETRWTVHQNKFKVIIELKVGENSLVFRFVDQVLHVKLVYKQRITDYTVCPVYVICADHDGRFQVPISDQILSYVQTLCSSNTDYIKFYFIYIIYIYFKQSVVVCSSSITILITRLWFILPFLIYLFIFLLDFRLQKIMTTPFRTLAPK